MKNRNVVYIRVLLVILAIVIFLAFINRSPQRTLRDTWLPSSFNPVGAGSMAFFQTLRDLHWPVDRWREPLGRLPSRDNGGSDGNLLVITRSQWGSSVSFSDQEIDLLDQWVRKGNTLLLLGDLVDWDDTRAMLAEFGFALPEKGDGLSRLLQPFAQRTPEQTLELAPAPNSGVTGTMVLPQTTPLPVAYPKGAKVLWGDHGQPYLVEVPVAHGRVICVASERLLSNSYLNKGDNLAIVLRLLAPSGVTPPRILFEESHHGFSAVYAMVHLLEDQGVRFAGMLALLGALAFLGSSLVRFGPVLALSRESGRSALEFIDSVAHLYLRADLRNDTIRYLFQETHQRLLVRLNLPSTTAHEVIASRLEQAHPHLPKWKKLAQRFDSPDYVQGLPPSGWLRVAKDLIEIKSAMA